ncbi:hypothetical protein PIB30_060574 [Stylosanthes scabra]|uniref:Transmembrane protein n=1 Tax=Stylosanthes scabra TaxID=79078 RepID=A0ABU6WMA6_9FABA|nr:hypothetical protein [Stylosanthes scabra]
MTEGVLVEFVRCNLEQRILAQHFREVCPTFDVGFTPSQSVTLFFTTINDVGTLAVFASLCAMALCFGFFGPSSPLSRKGDVGGVNGDGWWNMPKGKDDVSLKTHGVADEPTPLVVIPSVKDVPSRGFGTTGITGRAKTEGWRFM